MLYGGPASCLAQCPIRRRAQGRPTTCWRDYISYLAWNTSGSPRGNWRTFLGQGLFGCAVQSAATTTCPRRRGRQWMNGWRRWNHNTMSSYPGHYWTEYVNRVTSVRWEGLLLQCFDFTFVRHEKVLCCPSLYTVCHFFIQLIVLETTSNQGDVLKFCLTVQITNIFCVQFSQPEDKINDD